MNKQYLQSIALSVLLFLSGKAIAQQAEGMSYQAAFRNSSGPVAGATVNMQFTISRDSAAGTVVYRETQTATATSLGVVNCMIGTGTPTIGVWKGIDWTYSPIYINAQADTAGGTAFVDLGSSQLVASPYAKNANGITMFQNGTLNPNKMLITHSPAYPTWGLRYNDTLDEFVFVGGGTPSVNISSWSGGITAHNAYSTTPYPFSSSAYGNIKAEGNITTGNKVQRGADTSNMVAIAWGTISAAGVKLTGSNNFTVTHTGTGIYTIAIAGETYYYADYTAIATIAGGLGLLETTSGGGNLEIFAYNIAGVFTDFIFQFVVYKK
jgi:hypothetical protein